MPDRKYSVLHSQRWSCVFLRQEEEKKNSSLKNCLLLLLSMCVWGFFPPTHWTQCRQIINWSQTQEEAGSPKKVILAFVLFWCKKKNTVCSHYELGTDLCTQHANSAAGSLLCSFQSNPAELLSYWWFYHCLWQSLRNKCARFKEFLMKLLLLEYKVTKLQKCWRQTDSIQITKKGRAFFEGTHVAHCFSCMNFKLRLWWNRTESVALS